MLKSFKVAALSYSFSEEQSNMQKNKTVFSQVMQMPDTKCRLIFSTGISNWIWQIWVSVFEIAENLQVSS